MKNQLMNEESGQGMVEYGLILALIAVAAIAIFTTMGSKVKEVGGAVNNGLGNAIA